MVLPLKALGINIWHASSLLHIQGGNQQEHTISTQEQTVLQHPGPFTVGQEAVLLLLQIEHQ